MNFRVLYSKEGTRLIKGNRNLKRYQIKEGTKVICDEAFFRSSLQEIVIPKNVTSIGNYAFCYCCYEIKIPASVREIIGNPFVGIHTIKNDSPYFKVVDGVLYDAEMTTLRAFLSEQTEFTIPSGVTSIGNEAFACCSLQKIVIPQGVTSIGDYAFDNCGSLKEITIPQSVTDIGKSVFYDCISLEEIKIPKGSREKFEKLFGNDELSAILTEE